MTGASACSFDGPTRAVQCAEALRAGLARLGLAQRAGLHTGEVALRGDNVSGMAVHLAARVAAVGGPGEIVTTATVKYLTAGSALTFADRGEHALKGIPERWHLYIVQP